jgi:ABC-type sugar transport system substrate-binding protein
MAPGSIAVGSTDIPPAHQKAITDGWVQWGIDQQFYLMGFFGAAAAYGKIEGQYPYPNIRTGGEVVTAENLKMVGDRSEIWLAKAKAYGFM